MASLNKLILLLAVLYAVVLLTSSRAIVATNQQTKLNGYRNDIPGYGDPPAYGPPTYVTCPIPQRGCARRFGAKGVHNTAAVKTKKDGPKN